ncbi:hypothetical protein [Bacillus sp. AFS075034]|uniref:hypothetical protein n=1 Tax=Bacillus sp. AFS075034 TaxID=2034281 RepID=UPI000BF81B2E|nr:hypothetical protein [Bacillus sp. AFS075034]PFW61564.1 hypothetical protein COL20_17130 [Bacillus sp. AFS075034]
MINVMQKAWEIAKDGQKKFGGKVKEYFSQALRMAWVIYKKGAAEMVELQGTEKQVAWANDIRKDVKEMFSILKVKFMSEKAKKMEKESYRTKREVEFALYEETILNNTSAKFFIENFGYLNGKELGEAIAITAKETAVANNIVPVAAQVMYSSSSNL